MPVYNLDDTDWIAARDRDELRMLLLEPISDTEAYERAAEAEELAPDALLSMWWDDHRDAPEGAAISQPEERPSNPDWTHLVTATCAAWESWAYAHGESYTDRFIGSTEW